MNFLTTGEKIRSLRKKMDMRQQELEDINITRAFISMIETGKRGLSKDTAKIIADKLSGKAQSIGLELAIDTDYLLRTPSEDAEIYCYDKLNNFPTNDEIDVIVSIAKSYSLIKVEAMAYKILGDYNFENKNNIESFIQYMISLDLYKETEEKAVLSYLYYRLGLCKLNQLEYIEAISFFNRADHYSRLYDNIQIKKSTTYSRALAYKSLQKYNEGLKYAEKFIVMCNKEVDVNEYAEANILKVKCLSCMNNGDKAISLLDNLVRELSISKVEIKWQVYKDIAKVYLEEGCMGKSMQYLELAEELVNNVDNKQLACVYINKAKVYLRNKFLDDAALFINKCLRLSAEKDDLTVESYYILIDIYSGKKDFVNLKNTYIKLLEILKDKEYYKQEVLKLYNKLALLYLEQNDIEMCKKYLYMIS